jgi:Flp pilus assembly protein TadG
MNCLHRFASHNGGVSAVEFALAAPLLVMMLVGMMTTWTYLTQTLQMRSAVKTGANYVLQGGTDLGAARSAVLLSWAKKPADADVQVARQCTCSGTVSICSAVCTGSGAIPNMSVIISANASLDTPLDDLFTTAKILTRHEEIIRVR